MNDKNSIYDLKRKESYLTNFDNSSLKHPRFPVRTDTGLKSNLNHTDTGLSSASTEFLIESAVYQISFIKQVGEWKWEILCLFLSTISLLAVVVVLTLSNGQQLPKLPFAISLNTVVSYLGVIYKAALLGVISSCIGQLKWCWYRNRGGLQHFDVLDGVSRSPLTAFLILFSWRPYKWIYFGATLMLLTAFIDPFLQQVISSPLTAVQSNVASIPRAQEYDAGADLVDLEAFVQGQFDFGLKAAMYQGLFAPQRTSDISFNCPSGNCTYPDFDSLAFCSKCTNITDQVTTSDNPFLSQDEDEKASNYTFKVPFVNPITINTVLGNGSVVDGPSLVSVPFDTFAAQAAIGIANPLVAFSMLHWGELDNANAFGDPHGNYSTQPPEAYQCAIYFCLNAYSSKATDGKLDSEIVSTYVPSNGTPLGLFGGDSFDRFANVSDLLMQRPSDFPHSTANNTFYVPRSTVGMFAEYLEHFFTGYEAIRLSSPFNDETPINVNNDTSSNNTSSGYPPLPFTNDTMAVFSNQTSINVPMILDGMVTTMTNYIRIAALIQDSKESTMQGTSYSLTPLTHVDFRWLALPAALIVFGTAFLIYTANLSARLGIPVWKDSALAILFHGLDEVSQNSIVVAHGPPMRMRDMERIAKKTSVLLQDKANGDMRLSE